MRVVRTGAANDSAVLCEEVAIDLLDRVAVLDGHPDVMISHQLRKTLTVDEHDAILNEAGVLNGLATERGRGDEHALLRASAL